MSVPSTTVPVRLRLAQLTKRYGALAALQHVSLDVYDGEFVTLLGPSGCGKTTTLMLIAGLERPQAGEVWLDGVRITRQPAWQRQIGVVFQSGALFPHLTVFDNLAFPLRMRGLAGADVRARVSLLLDLVRLGDLAQRYPQQLSGGQQQRVAIARALIFEPRLLLMDEPFGALDRKLREHLQDELKRLQARLHMTIVYVTHDQAEALALSDRIALMQAGTIVQVGHPRELYERPASAFVADFLGECNLLPGVLLEMDAQGGVVQTEGGLQVRTASRARAVGDRVTLALRPERIRLLVQHPRNSPWVGTTDDRPPTTGGAHSDRRRSSVVGRRARSTDVRNAPLDSPDSALDCCVPAWVEQCGYLGESLRCVVRMGTGERLIVRHPAGTPPHELGPGMRISVGWQSQDCWIV